MANKLALLRILRINLDHTQCVIVRLQLAWYRPYPLIGVIPQDIKNVSNLVIVEIRHIVGWKRKRVENLFGNLQIVDGKFCDLNLPHHFPIG